MYFKNTTRQEMLEALTILNQKYDNNVEFVYLDWNTSRHAVQCTLRVKESHGKGARLSQSQTSLGNHRHLINACWHVHGDLFETILKLNPNVVIYAEKNKIDKHGGNWQDWNIGSIMNPLYYSEACECGN